jgi:hypothetical protein
MTYIGLEAEPTKQQGRRKIWRQRFPKENVAVMKLELAGSGHERWYYREGAEERGLKPLTGYQAGFRVAGQIVEKGDDETYSIAGPLAVGGASDSGPNSIKKKR